MKQVKYAVMALTVTIISLSGIVQAQVIWDFEGGNDHGFRLWCVYPAAPAPDDPTVAGDEAVTGEGELPYSGNVWAIGPPNQYDGLIPAVEEGCHVVGGILEYGDCNDPFGVYTADPPSFINSRGQSSYLNTYNLSQWGDDLHTQDNDQIATSPAVLLGENAELIVWSYGGGSTGATIAPEPDSDRYLGYINQSCGVAVLSAEDSSFLASVLTQKRQYYGADTLDLSLFAGATVVFEVVDAFQGAWGWLCVDEIQVTHSTEAGTAVDNYPSTGPAGFELSQNYPNPFNPETQFAFFIPANMHISLEIFNMQGQSVATVVNKTLSAGSYRYPFSGKNLPSGVYYYKLQSANGLLTRKMILMK